MNTPRLESCMRHGAPSRSGRAQRGVTLVEVLVALVVVSIGLLGIAKMQALAISSTRGTSTRSLIAIETASLGAVMHANKLYWSSVATVSTTFTASVTGNTISASSDANLTAAAGTSCLAASTACTGAQMAAYDLQNWGSALTALAPSAIASIDCSGAPVTCTVTVNWNENLVGMNASTQNTGTNDVLANSYALMVQP
jgi:type IV pilus assembly protein PilV